MLLEREGGATLAAILVDAGVELDLAHALAIERAVEARDRVVVNAGLMLHEHGADEDTVRAYLAHWGLMSEKLSAHMLRFLGEPTSRTYPITYAVGRELCREYVAGDMERFGRLLTVQVRVGELVAAQDV
jgi:hypothetical protein